MLPHSYKSCRSNSWQKNSKKINENIPKKHEISRNIVKNRWISVKFKFLRRKSVKIGENQISQYRQGWSPACSWPWKTSKQAKIMRFKPEKRRPKHRKFFRPDLWRVWLSVLKLDKMRLHVKIRANFFRVKFFTEKFTEKTRIFKFYPEQYFRNMPK